MTDDNTDTRRDARGRLTYSVIGSFFDVQRGLGFGFREFIYSLALERDLVAKGHRVDREVRATVCSMITRLATQTLDMVVDQRLVVENKSTERLHPNSSLQLFSYLCATGYEVGLVLHFGREPNFHRVVYENRFKAHSASHA